MLSVPPATTVSASPDSTAAAANATDLRPDAHAMFRVVAGTDSATPPASAASRAGFCPTPA